MAYTREEMETVCRYDYLRNEWVVYTNVQKHITKLNRIAGKPIQSEIDGNRLISGTWKVGNSQVRFAKLIERNSGSSEDSEEENED